jgi:hypothetical protein
MPLPSAPRRAAPPRKKAPKSPMPLVTAVDAPLTESSDILSTADTPGFTKKAKAGDVEQEIGDVSREVADLLSHAEAVEVASEIPEESEISGVGETRGAENAEEPTQVHDDDGIAEADNKRVSVNTVTSTQAQDVSHHDDTGEYKQSTEVPVEHEHTTANLDKGPMVRSTDEPDEDEEVARRKRVTEKLAKMGGINPLAPQPRRSSSTDEAQGSPPVSPSLVKRASLSRRSADTSPSAQRRQSLRKSSVGSTMVSEEDTASTQRKPSFDGTQSPPSVSPRLAKRISLSRQSTDSLPPPRKQSSGELSADSTTATAQIPESHTNQTFAIPPTSRKSSVGSANTEIASDFVSGRESQDGKY